jgi:glycerol-1-phosphate dehydrogenase [NAD(P)+]
MPLCSQFFRDSSHISASSWDCGAKSFLLLILLLQSATVPTLSEALNEARDTRRIEISPGAAQNIPAVFRQLFADQPAIIIADPDTFRAAGGMVAAAFQAARRPMLEPFIFREPDLHAEHRFVDELETALSKHAGIPIAVGSGTINDLTKLAAHRANRPYLSVATAASMDGYTAFGASITFQGDKQTFPCPAPVAVVADLDIISAAPNNMNAWGYADLLAKVTAGADWLVADALGAEAIHPQAWAMTQGRLRDYVKDPAGVRARNPAAIAQLVEGLMMGGLAMQAAQSSRVASGAEHQFSHLWDMQHHTYQGHAPSHGFKVGIGTLAVAAFYERLLQRPLESVDIEQCCATWPDQNQWLAKVRDHLGASGVAAVASREILAKAGDRDTLRSQLVKLHSIWPELRQSLRAQLIPFAGLRDMLQAAGAPVEPEQIGISRQRLRASFWPAFFLRRRFTALDLAVRAGLFDSCVDELFAPGGPWPIAA